MQDGSVSMWNLQQNSHRLKLYKEKVKEIVVLKHKFGEQENMAP